MNTRIRILVVDDHPMVLKGLVATLAPEPDLEVVACAATGSGAVHLFRTLNPDVTVMDIGLESEMAGIEAIREIRRESPNARILVLSAKDGEGVIFHAIQAGAVTYLLKDRVGDNLVSVIREVYSGGGRIPEEVARKLADRISQPALSTREIEVLQLVANGSRNKEISVQLKITEQTVEFHLKNIRSKLRVNDRTAAVMAGVRRGIINIGKG